MPGTRGGGPGQLSGIGGRSLGSAPSEGRFVFDENPDAVWESALRLGGIDPITLVPGGEPS